MREHGIRVHQIEAFAVEGSRRKWIHERELAPWVRRAAELDHKLEAIDPPEVCRLHVTEEEPNPSAPAAAEIQHRLDWPVHEGGAEASHEEINGERLLQGDVTRSACEADLNVLIGQTRQKRAQAIDVSSVTFGEEPEPELVADARQQPLGTSRVQPRLKDTLEDGLVIRLHDRR